MEYQQYYKKLIDDQSVYSLVKNYNRNLNSQIQQQVFTTCPSEQIPEFFVNNLVSPNRIIKKIVGENCVYQAFYFQLFKLMFEIQNQEKDYLEVFKEIFFDPGLLSKGNSSVVRGRTGSKMDGAQSRVSHSSRNSQIHQEFDQQKKKQFLIHQKCIAQFIQIVIENKYQYPSFQNYLNLYPFVSQSVLIFLKKFIQNAGQEQQMDSVQIILQYLSQIFQIQLVVFQNCFKFQESDIFLYVQESERNQGEIEVYITFNEIEDQEEEGNENSQNGQNDIKDDQNYHQPSKISSNKSQKNQKYQLTRNIMQKPQPSGFYEPYHQEPHSNYKDNVVTSEYNFQQSNKKRFHEEIQFPEPKINNLSASVHELQENNQNMGRNTRIISQTTAANRNIKTSSNDQFGIGNNQVFKQDNNLSKSNQIRNYQWTNSISSLPNDTANKFYSPRTGNTVNNQQIGFQSRKESEIHKPFDFIVENGRNDVSRGFQKIDRGNQPNFHKKKVNYIDEVRNDQYLATDDMHRQSSIEDLTSQKFKRQQSQTNVYNQQAFIHKQPTQQFHKKQRKSSLQDPLSYGLGTNTQRSFYVTQHDLNHVGSYSKLNGGVNQSRNDIYDSKKFSESKTDTIINMFGDMLKSTANINNIDQSFTGNNGFGGFGSSTKNFVEQPERDVDNGHQQSKILVNEGILTNSSYKKPASMNKFGYGISTNMIGSSYTNKNIDGSSHMEMNVNMKKSKIPENNIFIESTTNPGMVSGSGIFEKVQIRQTSATSNNFSSTLPYQNFSNQNYKKSLINRSENPKVSFNNYDRIHESSVNNQSDSSLNGRQQQQGLLIPAINVNTVRSYSSNDSERQKMEQNNYWDNQLKSSFTKQGIKTERNEFQNKKYYDEDTKNRQLMNMRQFSVKSQQFGNKDYIQKNQDKILGINQHSRAYSSNYQQINNSKINKKYSKQQNEEEDFFFRPNIGQITENFAKTMLNSKFQSQKYKLKTIEEVRASRETNKQSFRPQQGSSKFSSGGQIRDLGSNGSGKFAKYQSVNSVQGWHPQSNDTLSIKRQNEQKKPSIVMNLQNSQNQKRKSRIFEKQKVSKQFIDHDDSINNGSFYKQFTNTKILKMLKQPHQTKVQILKNRFRGERRTKVGGNFLLSNNV